MEKKNIKISKAIDHGLPNCTQGWHRKTLGFQLTDLSNTVQIGDQI